jgi:hypothetical protein
MAERDVTQVTKSGEARTIALSKARELEPKENETKEEKRARFTRILERGIVADRLLVELPNGLHGEWVPRDQTEIERKKLLGFWIDEKHAQNRSLHGDGTGAAIIGDTVFMVCDRETKELIDEVKRERYRQRHGKPGEDKRKQEEEKAYTKQVDHQLGMPVIDESSARTAKKEDIEKALSEQ